MERINVTEAFRFEQTNCSFKMLFNENADMERAYAAMEAAIQTLKNENGYYQLWLQDLHDCCDSQSFEIESTLFSEEFNKYIPAMCTAVANALPEISFSAYANYDDLRCLYIDEFEISYNDHRLVVTETFEDDSCGYFCPNCGECIDRTYATFDEDEEIECGECEESFKLSDLKFVPPIVTNYEIKIG